MLARTIPPQDGLFQLFPTSGPPGIPNVLRSIQVHQPRAGLVHLHAPQAGANRYTSTSVSGRSQVNLFAVECFCVYVPPQSPPASTMPLGGSALAITAPGHTTTNASTGQTGIYGLPPLFPGGYVSGSYGFWFGGQWYVPYFGPWGWGWIPSSWYLSGPSPSPSFPPPPPSHNARIIIGDLGYLAVGSHVSSDGAGVVDRASAVVRWSILGLETIGFYDSTTSSQPSRTPIPENDVAIADAAFLAAEIRPTGLESFRVVTLLPISKPTSPVAKESVGISDIGQFFAGPNLCYGPISIYDYSLIQASYVVPPGINPEEVGVFLIADRARVVSGAPPFAFDTLHTTTSAQVETSGQLRGSGPQPVGTVDVGLIHITAPIVGIEILGVSNAAAGVPGLENITGNVLIPRDTVSQEFPAPSGTASDTAAVTDAVSQEFPAPSGTASDTAAVTDAVTIS